MTIGIFTFDFYPFEGGIGSHVYRIYYQGISKKKEILFFSPCTNQLPNHKRIAKWTKKIGKNLFFSLMFNFRLKAICKKQNLEKIHIHCGPGGVFLRKKNPNLKTIAIFHHTYYQQQKYIKSQKWKKIFLRFEMNTVRNVDRIIAVSNDTKNAIIERYNVNESKITVIPNCIDIEKFYPINSIKKDPNSILYFGRLDERKGIKFLFEAFQDALDENKDLKLYIIGKGPYYDFIDKEIKSKDISNCELLGFIPDNELNEWINKVSCVIIPSIFEGFGISVIEAMATKTPVIGTNVDGIKGIIKNGKTGFLIEYGDKKGLKEKINYVLENDVSDIVDNAFIEVLRNYSIKSVIKKIKMEELL